MNTATAKNTATPAKLSDGSWGARCPMTVQVGETVTIRAVSGKTWQARVAKVIWRGSDAALCAMESLDRPRRDSTYRSVAAATRAGGCHACRECGGPVQSYSEGRSESLCHDCV